MEIIESLEDIPVQNPQAEDFSYSDLTWTKFGTTEHHDVVAVIPYTRVEEFILGECANPESPTRFHIERRRERSCGSLKVFKPDEYLEYTKYWCSFGPENYGEGGRVLPSRKYRLNTRNRAARPQSMRGCKCHFVVKRLYARPSLALIVYYERRHVNEAGFVCHGPLDRDAIGPGAKKIPYICNEIQQQTMSMIYLGIPEENVLEKHIEGVQRYCGPDATVDGLASQYVHKLGMIIKRSTHELDLDDHASIKIWAERNKKSIFTYQEDSESDQFVLGIQTEWQLQQFVRFGHCGLVAADSTFGIKRLKYPLCTLLVFDSRHHALPVAWIISRSNLKSDVDKWMKILLRRAQSVEPGFRISGFIVDDAAMEIDPIRDTFCCPILFSLWRIRRSWLRNVVKKCDTIEVQRELFKCLGEVVYSIWDGGLDTSKALERLTLDFSDQTAFMQYFTSTWLPKIGMWLSSIKSLPLASQEACGAIEAYHVKLKVKLFDDTHLNALQRVDWLVHKLTTELHSSYWLDRYADESDSFQNIQEEYIASTSWHRASEIPDSAVSLDSNDTSVAKVLSQRDTNVTRVVWNPCSEFAFCDCAWSLQGNLCKHIIKVNTMCENREGYGDSMSLRSFKEKLRSIKMKPMDDSMALDLSMSLALQMFDQIKQLVKLSGTDDISSIVNGLPVKWGCKKGRTTVGIPASIAAFTKKRSQKRKR
ncbi:SWIM zinc finger family protein [Hirschfeldia incana]|nr:SWIM zinc finger family protein [Hirschfeldia incana]